MNDRGNWCCVLDWLIWHLVTVEYETFVAIWNTASGGMKLHGYLTKKLAQEQLLQQ